MPRVVPRCSTRAHDRHRSSNAQTEHPADPLQPIRLPVWATTMIRSGRTCCLTLSSWCQWRSPDSFRRPTVGQRVPGLSLRRISCAGCLPKLCLQRIVLALLEAGIDTSREIASTGSPRRAQDDFFLPSGRPPFHFGGRAGDASSRYALLPLPPAQPRRHSNSSACATAFPNTRSTPKSCPEKSGGGFKKDSFVCCPQVLDAIDLQLITIHVKSQPT
jgi:hypothetical protein